MWDNILFDEAFDRAGIRVQATLLKGGYPDFQVKFERPQQIMLDDQVHTTNYSIEYTTGDVPSIARNDQVRIDGVTYRVIQPPVAQGDGYWTIAELEGL